MPDDYKLVKAAVEALKASYSPYSGFMVGAALLTAGGKIYTGCNIENAAYTPTVCAERTAFFKAVSEGEREFIAIAVAGRSGGRTSQPEGRGYAYPCGVCRQVMMEFCVPSRFRVLVARGENDFRVHTLSELLPHGFGPEDLQRT